MKDYSFRKNLSYMAMAFYRPKLLIEIFLTGLSPPYSIVPLVIFTVLFETSYILDYYLFKSPPVFHLIPRVFHISDVQYNFYQMFLLPVVHVADFFLFYGMLRSLSRFLRLPRVDPVKAVLFFMFIWNTIGLPAFVTENLGALWRREFYYFQPIYLMVYLLYPAEFFHKQAAVGRGKSFAISAALVAVFLAFRMVFLG